MATVSAGQRAARALLESAGCVLLCSAVDALEPGPVVARLQTRLNQLYTIDDSMMAEHRAVRAMIQGRFVDALQQTSLKGPSVENLNEFLGHLGVDEAAVRQTPRPDWSDAEGDQTKEKDLSLFKEQLCSLTRDEKSKLGVFRSESQLPLLRLLELQAQRCGHLEKLDAHFQHSFDLLEEALETSYCGRMDGKEALVVEREKLFGKVVLCGALTQLSRKVVYRNWAPLAAPRRLLGVAVLGLLGLPLAVLITLQANSRLEQRGMSRALADYVLADDLSDAVDAAERAQVSAEAQEHVRWLLEDSVVAAAVPLGATPSAPLSAQSLTIYGLIRPLGESVVFMTLLLPSLRSFLAPWPAHLCAAAAMTLYRSGAQPHDAVVDRRRLPAIEAFVSCGISSAACTLLASTGVWGLAPAAHVVRAMVETGMWMRDSDHLLRQTWPLTDLIHGAVLASESSRSATLAPASAELVAWARQLADELSTDHFAEPGVRGMSAGDVCSALVAIDRQPPTPAGTKSPSDMIRSIWRIMMDNPRSPAGRRELSTAMAEYNADLSLRAAMLRRFPARLTGTEFAQVLAEHLRARPSLCAEDVQAVLRDQRRFDDPATGVEAFLDLLQGYYECVLEADQLALEHLDAAAYHELEVHQAGRALLAQEVALAHTARVQATLVHVRAWHAAAYLRRKGLSTQRFADLLQRLRARDPAVGQLTHEWDEYLAGRAYSRKLAEGLMARGPARRYMRTAPPASPPLGWPVPAVLLGPPPRPPLGRTLGPSP